MTGKRLALWLLAVLIGYHALLGLGFAKAFHIVAGIALAITFWRIGWANALLTSVSMALGVVLLNLGISLTKADHDIYGSPHAYLTTWDFEFQHRRYQKNRDIRAPVRRSDLAGLSTEAIKADLRPAHHRFRTDSFGFRNSVSYHGQPLVLVGDSFIAGSATDQDDILVEQLRHKHGLDVYAMGHAGNCNDYLRYIQGLDKRSSKPFKVILFMFEGNDFEERVPANPNPRQVRDKRRTLFERHRRLFDGTPGFRFTQWLYHRAMARFVSPSSDKRSITQLGGSPVALYKVYTKRSSAESYEPLGAMYAELDAIAPWLAEIYFIPTKYRVYHRLLDKPVPPLPHRRWEWLSRYCAEKKLPCTDLTPALTAAATRHLRNSRTVFWRDDTHWNGLGIAVAAEIVAARHGGDPGLALTQQGDAVADGRQAQVDALIDE